MLGPISAHRYRSINVKYGLGSAHPRHQGPRFSFLRGEAQAERPKRPLLLPPVSPSRSGAASNQTRRRPVLDSPLGFCHRRPAMDSAFTGSSSVPGEAPTSGEHRMGTTIVGVCYDGGVVLGADSRTSTGTTRFRPICVCRRRRFAVTVDIN
jgi:hypothetical protein